MDRINQARTAQEAFELTIQALVEELSCERALLFFGYNEEGLPCPRASYGLDHTTLYLTGEVSLQLLQVCWEESKPSNILDALNDPQVGSRTSMVISGIRSVMSVPLMGSTTHEGMIYVDNRLQAGAFRDEHLEVLIRVGQELMARLKDLGESV